MRIIRAQLGPATRFPGSHGDNWNSTWAGDDALYSVSDDTKGFNRACSNNLAIHRIEGADPTDLQAATVNCMEQFGRESEFLPEDAGMWKGNGLTCIDGVLYLSVSRHSHFDLPGERFFIQETWDASIVKSEDFGETWSPTPRLGHSMFPGPSFSAPVFVHYGKDGQGDVDAANAYVYAVSSTGAWNNGSSMTLGRVPRDRIARLHPTDWEFAHGFDAAGNPIWRPRHDTAHYVFRAPGRTSMTGIHHVAPLGLYIMPQWHFPYLDDPERRWHWTRFELFQAPHPWGPWSLFHTQDFAESWYNPAIPSKFIAADGTKHLFFVAGDFKSHQDPEGAYGLHMLPMTLDVEE